mmetsp:Transcript_26192/g.69934  ORF Transcript_26192/g.69934 Transcript_26192/m.69934 type:complete len:375 (-) Transcript_26192:117-1241(-)
MCLRLGPELGPRRTEQEWRLGDRRAVEDHVLLVDVAIDPLGPAKAKLFGRDDILGHHQRALAPAAAGTVRLIHDKHGLVAKGAQHARRHHCLALAEGAARRRVAAVAHPVVNARAEAARQPVEDAEHRELRPERSDVLERADGRQPRRVQLHERGVQLVEEGFRLPPAAALDHRERLGAAGQVGPVVGDRDVVVRVHRLEEAPAPAGRQVALDVAVVVAAAERRILRHGGAGSGARGRVRVVEVADRQVKGVAPPGVLIVHVQLHRVRAARVAKRAELVPRRRARRRRHRRARAQQREQRLRRQVEDDAPRGDGRAAAVVQQVVFAGAIGWHELGHFRRAPDAHARPEAVHQLLLHGVDKGREAGVLPPRADNL